LSGGGAEAYGWVVLEIWRTAAIGVGALFVVDSSFAKPPEWSCVDNAEIRVGKFLLSNNVWNKGTIRDYEQCIAQDGDVLKWRWRWPGGDLMPEAYPEIVFGLHPWRKVSTTPELPLRLVDLRELTVEYAAELQGDGVHNLSFQLWLVDRVPPSPDAARTEVMVWVANRGMRPAGRWSYHLGKGDGGYDVYESQRKHLDGEVWREWRLITLVAREERLTGPLDIRALLMELAGQRLAAKDPWIANVDLGTEVVAGAGSAAIRAYRINVR
jgi:hypothetical protein